MNSVSCRQVSTSPWKHRASVPLPLIHDGLHCNANVFTDKHQSGILEQPIKCVTPSLLHSHHCIDRRDDKNNLSVKASVLKRNEDGRKIRMEHRYYLNIL